MSNIHLQRGDHGDQVQQLQSLLNKVGAMLIADGDFGPGTEKGVKYAQDVVGQPVTGVVESLLWEWLLIQPDPYANLHSDGLAFIAKEETGGLGYYEQITRWPHYPGHESGITIGVGYDLRFSSKEALQTLWQDYLPREHIKELSRDIGKKGSKSRAKKLKKMGIDVPFKAAWPVFIELTLPAYYDKTLSIYPSLPKLPDFCRTVLVSLVFNRGTKLTGSKRKEMKRIQEILEQADNNELSVQQRRELLISVEDEIVSMKRLWSPGSGLIRRRQAEANLWRRGILSLS